MNRRPLSQILLLIGMVFLITGMSTDQEMFTYIAIGLALIALVLNTKLFRKK